LVSVHFSDIINEVKNEKKLITDYSFELVEDFHNPGSGRYGARVNITADIGIAFPYLNAVLEDSVYDHENKILIGIGNGKRYAFRSHEINLGMVADPQKASKMAEDAVEFVNGVWADRDNITPSLKERKKPPAFEIYKLLPGKNCKECGYATCIAFAADLRAGAVALDKCPLLLEPEYSDTREKIIKLFSMD
jgi:ArsR family metal-binding transcriptional regulator